MSEQTPSGAARISTCARPTSCTSAARSRAASRPLLRGDRRQGRVPGQRGAWPRARTRATPSSRRARRSAAGRRDGVQPRSGALPRGRADGGPARRSSSTRWPPARGSTDRRADAVVDAAIDRWVWYAGWTDKVAAGLRPANPVAGPYFDFSAPEPTGVVAVLAPQRSSLLGLVSVVAPAIVTGNTVVVLASEARPLPAVTLSEVLATSDVPGGVVNVLTGRTAEVAPVARLARGRQRHRPGRCGRATLACGDLEVAGRRQPQAGAAGRRRAGRRLGRRTPGLDGCSPTSRPRRSGTPSASEA